MTIDTGYYIAQCVSMLLPAAKKDSGTFYLPFNITKNEDGYYEYDEYRFNLPINYEINLEHLLECMVDSLDEYQNALRKVGVIE